MKFSTVISKIVEMNNNPALKNSYCNFFGNFLLVLNLQLYGTFSNSNNITNECYVIEKNEYHHSILRKKFDKDHLHIP